MTSQARTSWPHTSSTYRYTMRGDTEGGQAGRQGEREEGGWRGIDADGGNRVRKRGRKRGRKDGGREARKSKVRERKEWEGV